MLLLLLMFAVVSVVGVVALSLLSKMITQPQAHTIGDVSFLAGQIPLDPPTMALCSSSVSDQVSNAAL
jgi:enamine deaminase RidA (YjgF/YER057c/UK114 family)